MSTTTIPRTLTATPRTAEEIARDPRRTPASAASSPTTWSRSAGPRTPAGTTPPLVPYGPIPIDPATNVLHYGQAIFEGLKAYRQADGSIATVPSRGQRRAASSARRARLAMPELPEELFLASIEALVDQDQAYVPADPEESLYLRPFMFSTEVGLGVRPANAYLYVLIASPAGAYFPRGVKPVSVWLSTEYVRAAPGGTGEAKCAGNYAASLVAQAQAADEGLRPGRVARRARAPLGRGDGRHEPVLRLRRRATTRASSPRSSPAALLAGVTRDSLLTGRQGPRLRRRGGAHQHRRLARGQRVAARSPRSSPAARPRSSPPSGR